MPGEAIFSASVRNVSGTHPARLSWG